MDRIELGASIECEIAYFADGWWQHNRPQVGTASEGVAPNGGCGAFEYNILKIETFGEGIVAYFANRLWYGEVCYPAA